MRTRILGILIALSLSLSSLARASVLGAFYLYEQVRLNSLGYTQNILPLTMPSGKTCHISYFHHRSSRSHRRYILLHGFLDRSLTWRQTIEQIPQDSAQRKNLILVDLPHHGDSSCAEVDSFDKAETFLKYGIAAIRGKERFRVSGIWTGSLGGLFGLALLNNYPDAQLSMVVPPLLAKPYADILAKQVAAMTSPQAVRNFLVKVPPRDKKLPLIDTVVDGLLSRAQFAKSIIIGVDAKHLLAGYAKTPHRVRIMVSEDDLLLPINEMDPQFTQNTKTHYQVIHGCGHSILRFCVHQAVPFYLGDTPPIPSAHVAPVANTSGGTVL